MLSTHSPCMPSTVRPAAVRTATLRLPKAQDANVASTTTPSQPTSGTGRPNAGCEMRCWPKVARTSMTRRISLKK